MPDADIRQSDQMIVLTPSGNQVLASMSVIALVALICAVGAIVLVRSVMTAMGVLAFVFMVPALSFAAYRKRARLYADANAVAFRDIHGRTRTCSRSDFGSIDLGRRRLEFRKRDGRVAFSVSPAYWSKEQITALSEFLGVRDVNSEEYMREWLSRGMRPPRP